MAVTTTKTNSTNNNLSTTLLLPFIIAISLLLPQLTYQNIKNQASYSSIGAGVSYNSKGKKQDAKIFFKAVADGYPNTKEAKEAKRYLK